MPGHTPFPSGIGHVRTTAFKRPWAFWLGVAGVTGGVLLHVPMFLGAKDDGYMLSGMPWDRWMIVGMGLMLIWSAVRDRRRLSRPVCLD